MSFPHCHREQEVVGALRSGRWTSAWGEEIRKHVAACAVCAEVAVVARKFQHETELAQSEFGQLGASLPSAGFVWWKAQLAARRAAEQRATAPITLAERAAFALGAFAVLVLSTWQWPQISAWLQTEMVASPFGLLTMPDFSATGDWLRRLAMAWPSQMPAFLLAAGAAFLTLMVLAAYVVWQDD